MGKWADAADGVSSARHSRCALGAFLDSLPDGERAELKSIFERSQAIASGRGRYTYLQKVIVAGDGPSIDTQAISAHIRGADKCLAS